MPTGEGAFLTLSFSTYCKSSSNIYL